MKKSKLLGIVGLGALSLLPFGVNAEGTLSGGISCPEYAFKGEDIVCEISLPNSMFGNQTLSNGKTNYYNGFSANYELPSGVLYDSFEVKNYTMDINANSASGFAIGKTSGFNADKKLAELKLKFDTDASAKTEYDIKLNNIDLTDLEYNSFSAFNENGIEVMNTHAVVKIAYLDLGEGLANNIFESGEGTNKVRMLYNLNQKIVVSDLLNQFKNNTNGIIKFMNGTTTLTDTSRLGTGNKLQFLFGSRKVEYDISIKGDVTGNGEVKMADVMKVATHIIEGNAIKGQAFEKAADVTGDGLIKMNDVMKMATFIIDGGEL